MVTFKMVTVLVLLALGVWIPATAEGCNPDPGPGPDATSRAMVEAWLRELMGDEAPPAPPKIVPVESDALRRVFPKDRFYAVRFMRYPRAFKPPRPLRMENLVRVRPGGKVFRVPSLNDLKRELSAALKGVDEARARDAVLAAIRLAEEFFQDGGYTFSVPESRVAVTRQSGVLIATAEARVVKGGEGAIAVTLRIDPSGEVTLEAGEVEGQNVRPDVRLR